MKNFVTDDEFDEIKKRLDEFLGFDLLDFSYRLFTENLDSVEFILSKEWSGKMKNANKNNT